MARSDPQQDAVYTWEGQWRDWAERRVSLTECRKVVRTACAHYRVPPPKVSRWRKNFCWCPDTLAATSRILDKPVIRLNAGGQNWATCLHEAAHWVLLHLAPTAQDHGPTWLGVYMWLLEKASMAPRAALVASARKNKLRWRRRSPESFGVNRGRRRPRN
jgi:hypothetical protein